MDTTNVLPHDEFVKENFHNNGKLPDCSPRRIVIERDLVQSSAFCSLSPIATKVLLIFLMKRRGTIVGLSSKRKKVWSFTNLNRLIFTYDEAQDQYGIARATFSRAISELIEKGFLSITELGGGPGENHTPTLYRLDERWQAWDTPAFQPISRINRNAHRFPVSKLNP